MNSRPAQCPRCGALVSRSARFCPGCGQLLQNHTGSASGAGRRILTVSLVGCASLVLLLALTAGGYVGYRYWSSLGGSGVVTNAPAGSSEVDVDWTGVSSSPPDLSASQQQVSPHLDRLSAALKDGNMETALSLALPELRDDLKANFEGQPERMARLARLLDTRRLIAVERELAEFEVTEDGRTFSVTLQRVGDAWLLHSF